MLNFSTALKQNFHSFSSEAGRCNVHILLVVPQQVVLSSQPSHRVPLMKLSQYQRFSESEFTVSGVSPCSPESTRRIRHGFGEDAGGTKKVVVL